MLDKKQMAAAQALPSGHWGGPLAAAQALPSGHWGGPLAAAQALAEGCRRICDLQGQCEGNGR